MASAAPEAGRLPHKQTGRTVAARPVRKRGLISETVNNPVPVFRQAGRIEALHWLRGPDYAPPLPLTPGADRLVSYLAAGGVGALLNLSVDRFADLADADVVAAIAEMARREHLGALT